MLCHALAWHSNRRSPGLSCKNTYVPLAKPPVVPHRIGYLWQKRKRHGPWLATHSTPARANRCVAKRGRQNPAAFDSGFRGSLLPAVCQGGMRSSLLSFCCCHINKIPKQPSARPRLSTLFPSTLPAPEHALHPENRLGTPGDQNQFAPPQGIV